MSRLTRQRHTKFESFENQNATSIRGFGYNIFGVRADWIMWMKVWRSRGLGYLFFLRERRTLCPFYQIIDTCRVVSGFQILSIANSLLDSLSISQSLSLLTSQSLGFHFQLLHWGLIAARRQSTPIIQSTEVGWIFLWNNCSLLPSRVHVSRVLYRRTIWISFTFHVPSISRLSKYESL